MECSWHAADPTWAADDDADFVWCVVMTRSNLFVDSCVLSSVFSAKVRESVKRAFTLAVDWP
jgi:hypothetical protein